MKHNIKYRLFVDLTTALASSLATLLVASLAAFFTTSCVVGPNFKSPPLNVPQKFIYDSLSKNDSIDYVQWWSSFNDPMLDTLIKMALDSNKNLAITVENIEQARLKARSAKAILLPSLSIEGGATLNYTIGSKLSQQYNAGFVLAWDVDLFGKLRRTAEGAKYDYDATIWGSRAIKLTLVGEVANNYFNLQQYRNNLQISEQTLASRSAAADLIDSMFYYGASTMIDLEQAKASKAEAAVAVEQYKRACLQTELALNLLLSQNPGQIEIERRPSNLVLIDIPIGLPSTLLERRPDVMESYFEAAAANAAIGVAIANRLPSLSLTAQGGLVSEIVKGITSGEPIGWNAAGSLLAPILNWGNNKRAVDIARSKSKAAVLNYQQTALTALSQVEQALVGVSTYKAQLEKQEQLLHSAKIAQQLSQELYNAGQVNYLNLLDADRTLFSAQLSFQQTLSQYRSSCVTLYKALGGGW